MAPNPPSQPQNEGRPLPQNRRQWVVVSYDIPDDRRRTKIMKTLEGYGRRAQYSVFECDLRPKDLDELQTRLRRIIHREEDDIRFYPLCEGCLKKVILLGRARLHRQAPYIMVPGAEATT